VRKEDKKNQLRRKNKGSRRHLLDLKLERSYEEHPALRKKRARNTPLSKASRRGRPLLVVKKRLAKFRKRAGNPRVSPKWEEKLRD